MTITHCVGIDFGTSTTKIVIRDLEFDEVKPVTYPNGNPVFLPSFVTINSAYQLLIVPPEDLNSLYHWRFENLKGKLLYPQYFKKEREDDNLVISLMENSNEIEIMRNDTYYRCFIALKLSYLMRRVIEWGSLQSNSVTWSLPIPVDSIESNEAQAMVEIFSKAIEFSDHDATNKSIYSRAEYKQIIKQFNKQPVEYMHPSLQILPEGICNIVAIASSTVKLAERFTLIDIGASTTEFLSFSFDLDGRPCVYYSMSYPLGIESLRSQELLSNNFDSIVLDNKAHNEYINNTVIALVNPIFIARDYYKNIGLVEVKMCGGGSLIPAFGEIIESIPRSRLQSYKVPKLLVLKDLSESVLFDFIPNDILPRYLVACGLSVLVSNFGRYMLPLELAKQFKEISSYEKLVPHSYLNDNWDYTAIK